MLRNRNSQVLVLSQTTQPSQTTRPFAVLERISHARLSRLHFIQSSNDAAILFRSLYIAIGIVVIFSIVNYILVSRFTEDDGVPSIEEGAITVAFLIGAVVYLYLSNRTQIRENEVRPIPASDDIELEDVRPRRSRFGRLARTLRNDRLRRRRGILPNWIQGLFL
jgi:hypothetical protein